MTVYILASKRKVLPSFVGFLLSFSFLKVDGPFFGNRSQKVRKRESTLIVAATYSKAVIDPKMMIALILNWWLCAKREICERFEVINAHLGLANKEHSQVPGFGMELSILDSVSTYRRWVFVIDVNSSSFGSLLHL